MLIDLKFAFKCVWLDFSPLNLPNPEVVSIASLIAGNAMNLLSYKHLTIEL